MASMSLGSSVEAIMCEQEDMETGSLLSTRSMFTRRRPRWVVAITASLAIALVAIPLVRNNDRGLRAATGRVVGAIEVKPKKAHKEEPSHKGDEDKDMDEDELIPDMGMGFPDPKWGVFKPSLFCWSVMNYKNKDEVETLKGQLRERIGIFACDNVAVLSGARVLLGDGHKFKNGSHVQVYSWLNPAHSVPMGNLQGGDSTNSFKNTDIFIGAWDILVKSGVVFGHDWTMKVDPDAVFFAHRMRWHVKDYTKDGDYTPHYFKNCDFKGPQLYGSLEVFNEAALRRYKDEGYKCKSLPWGGWGEDEWIDKCMGALGVSPSIDYNLVGDHRCMQAECYATDRVAFHDYKTWQSYQECHNHSVSAEKIKDGGFFCCMFGEGEDACNSCSPTNRQWPGSSFCGGSAWSCGKCGASTHWCRMDAKDHAISA